MKADYIIAIDPDIDKSGVAFLKVATRQIEVSSLTFVQLIDYFQHVKKESDESKETLVVVVEGGWNTTRVHRRSSHDNFGTASKKGYNVGRNHQRGVDIFEVAKSIGLMTVEQQPLVKCWKGRERKITHDEFASFTGIIGRTNQEERDAGLIAWSYANLPIRIKIAPK